MEVEGTGENHLDIPETQPETGCACRVGRMGGMGVEIEGVRRSPLAYDDYAGGVKFCGNAAAVTAAARMVINIQDRAK